jgi:hypothetical protein
MVWSEAASQGQLIRGRLIDTATDKKCSMVLISLLERDSSLIAFAHSDKEGRFELSTKIASGIYLLLIENPSYDPLYRRLEITEYSSYDLGIIVLMPKADTLQTVTVSPAGLRPHFRNDTMEYNTTNIKMNVNANVEEMIGRLPGLQVGSDGSITYNGQSIQQVLVDGREMFGPDLTLVTRNLSADMIAKVQIIDGKSKQAEFTGIDDGHRIKTLNLVLKEDSKREYFVKAGGGESPQGYYQLGGVLGAFKEKDQLMALGAVADNGNSGIDASAGGMSSRVFVEGGTNDPLGASAGDGIPNSIGGAIHYAHELGSDDYIDGYYRGGHLTTRPFSSSLTEQLLPDSTYIQQQQNNSINSQQQQYFESNLHLHLDSLFTIQARIFEGVMQGQNVFNSTGTSSFNDTLTNTSLRSLRSDVTNQNVRGDLAWRIRARHQAARIFSGFINVTQSTNNTGGYLYSIDHFYQSNGLLQSIDTTDQRKSFVTQGQILNSTLNYTVPLWKNTVLAASYELSLNNNRSQQFTYARADGKYQELVDSLSDNYQDIFLTQRSGLTLQSRGSVYDFVFTGNLMDYHYNEKNTFNDSVIRYNYFNFNPQFTFNLHSGPSANYSLTYNGSTQLPSITQLQPVQNNTNPLYITLGNPGLRPSYTYNFALSYHRSGSILFDLSLNSVITTNSISTKTYTDSLGRQISQAVNTNVSNSGGANISLNKQLKPFDIQVGINGSINYSIATNYINTLLSKNESYTAGGGFSLEKYVANVYNFRINTNFTYSSTTSSINTSSSVNYWTQNHTMQVGFFPFANLEVNSNVEYTWRQKTSVFDNNNSVTLWNASMNREFLDNRLTVQFHINDILGQNAGISRSIAANQISQTTSNVIGRYWMLSVVYHFTHKFKSR